MVGILKIITANIKGFHRPAGTRVHVTCIEESDAQTSVRVVVTKPYVRTGDEITLAAVEQQHQRGWTWTRVELFGLSVPPV